MNTTCKAVEDFKDYAGRIAKRLNDVNSVLSKQMKYIQDAVQALMDKLKSYKGDYDSCPPSNSTILNNI